MPIPIQGVDPAQSELLASLEAKTKQPNAFFRVMAHRPEVLKSFVPFYGAIAGAGTLDRRLKELVYLTCSYANRCAYCTAAHTAGARKAGIADAELRALQAGDVQPFSAAERAAIAYARDLTQTATATESREALFAHFTEEQIVELTLVAALANFTNRFNNGLWILPGA
ncbi:MAG: carboxymuconolactone decarboxylase family protein [Bryobacteraceae bacterium]